MAMNCKWMDLTAADSMRGRVWGSGSKVVARMKMQDPGADALTSVLRQRAVGKALDGIQI